MRKCVTDLKTRAEGREAYNSDEFQVEGYMCAYDLLHPEAPCDYGSILVAREDGTYTDYPMSLERGAFLKLKAVHDLMADAKAAARKG